MRDFDIDLDYGRKCLEANKKNHVTATYFLLFKKFLKSGGASKADARQPTYDAKKFLQRTSDLRTLIKRDVSENRATNLTDKPNDFESLSLNNGVAQI